MSATLTDVFVTNEPTRSDCGHPVSNCSCRKATATPSPQKGITPEEIDFTELSAMEQITVRNVVPPGEVDWEELSAFNQQKPVVNSKPVTNSMKSSGGGIPVQDLDYNSMSAFKPKQA